jgi:hypothetical protein
MKPKTGEAKSALVDAPEFRSEAEEAERWDRHQDLIADLLLKLGRRGRAIDRPPRCGLRPFRATMVSDRPSS